MDQFEQFTETKHAASIELLSKTFGIAYYFCDSLESLKKVIPAFYEFDQTAAVLEIKTDALYSAEALKNYFTYITNQYEQQRMAND